MSQRNKYLVIVSIIDESLKSVTNLSLLLIFYCTNLGMVHGMR